MRPGQSLNSLMSRLMASWDVIQANLVAYLIIAAVTTIVVMAVSGLVTQAVLKKGKKGAEKK